MMKKKSSSVGAKQSRTASCAEPNELVKVEQRMTSLEIAKITGKQHKNLMRDIREMEQEWINLNGLKFELVEYRDKKGETRPCYSLKMDEFLYVISKYNNRIRAILVKRWMELEQKAREQKEIAVSSAIKGLKGEVARLEDEKVDILGALEEVTPMVEYCKESLQSVSSFPVRVIAHQLGMTAQELNKYLCQNGIQYGQSGCYVPYARYARSGYTKSRTFNHRNADGSVSTVHRTTWTEPGVYFIVQRVKEDRLRALPKVKVVQLTLKFM